MKVPSTEQLQAWKQDLRQKLDDVNRRLELLADHGIRVDIENNESTVHADGYGQVKTNHLRATLYRKIG